MKNEKSLKIYEEATKYIPGGVNSPVRAFKSVGLDPIFIERAHGSRIYDVDGNEYIDYICSWGPLMLGHSPKEIVEGIEEVVYRGTSYGVPTAIQVEMAKLVVEAYPAIDQVSMVNSGTEATMSALRVARAYTNRNKILKFEGCYHGHSDALLVKSGSGIKKLEDLKGKVVFVQADSSALAAFTGEDATEENLALAAQFKTLQQVSDYNSAFMNLESGSADAVCMDMGVSKYQLEQRANKFTMLDETVSSEQYGIGFKLGNTALRDEVQTSLNDMLADGTFDKIAEKW